MPFSEFARDYLCTRSGAILLEPLARLVISFSYPLQPSFPKMKRALVVDDSMLIRHAVCSYFEDRGFAVESATNGQEAMEMVGRVRPDIILTDIHMPGVEGREFIQALRSNPQTSRVPIVVLTARNFSPDILVGMPADYVIFKDIDIGSQLQSVLESALPGESSEC